MHWYVADSSASSMGIWVYREKENKVRNCYKTRWYWNVNLCPNFHFVKLPDSITRICLKISCMMPSVTAAEFCYVLLVLEVLQSIHQSFLVAFSCQSSRIIAITAYKDVSGMFATSSKSQSKMATTTGSNKGQKDDTSEKENKQR